MRMSLTTRALNPLKPGYASAVGATAVQALPFGRTLARSPAHARRWRFPGGALEPDVQRLRLLRREDAADRRG